MPAPVIIKWVSLCLSRMWDMSYVNNMALPPPIIDLCILTSFSNRFCWIGTNQTPKGRQEPLFTKMCVWCSWHFPPSRNDRCKQRHVNSLIFDVALGDIARLTITHSNSSPHALFWNSFYPKLHQENWPSSYTWQIQHTVTPFKQGVWKMHAVKT